MKIRPLHDRIVVRPVEQGDTSEGGIFLPETARAKQQEGIIVAAGVGTVLQDGTIMPLSVKVGDRVIFSAGAGVKLSMEGEEYLLLQESGLFGVIEE